LADYGRITDLDKVISTFSLVGVQDEVDASVWHSRAERPATLMLVAGNGRGACFATNVLRVGGCRLEKRQRIFHRRWRYTQRLEIEHG